MEETLKTTSLFGQHQKENAKLIPFAGWQMPLEYRGILEEHRTVRKKLGLFDLSHMGELEISGEGALDFLSEMITGNLTLVKPGQALYSVMCRDDGGILDDLVVYRMENKFMLVVNASNTDKISKWLEEHLPPDVSVKNRTDEIALLSIQGAPAETFLQHFCPDKLSALSYYHFIQSSVFEIPAIISRTGYTGEDGFELYVEAKQAPLLWEKIREREIPPIGLGARDTLRLEATYLLYGNDMDETTTPLEVGLSRVVKFEKEKFIGKQALLRQKEMEVPRKLIAFTMDDRSVARKDYPILLEGKNVGRVTSGTFSPTLEKGIGLGLVETMLTEWLSVGSEISVEVRGQPHPAIVSKKPFVQGSVKRGT